MDHEIRIRLATIADSDTIYEFINQLENTVFDKELFKKYFSQNLHSESNHYLVAVVENQLVGFISCHGQILLHHSGLVYEIQELFVDKQYRNKGIGALLIAKLIERISAEDYKLLEVACSFKRQDTHRFYLANGFDQTHYKFTKPK